MNASDLRLIREKHSQLDTLLPALPADAWLIPCRENSDRAATLVAGFETIGDTVLVFTRSGQKFAIVTDYDQHDAEAAQVYDRVIPCSQGIAEPLRKLVREQQLHTFAMNFSEHDALIDGLTYGLLLKLKEALEEPDLESQLITAASMLSPLRSQKSPEELRRIKAAISLTESIFGEVDRFLKPGMSEQEVTAFIKQRQRHYGTSSSFGDGANVMAGRNGIGHRSATSQPITPGDSLIIDMGCLVDGYTSDIMRAYYFLDEGESQAPAEIKHRFAVAQEAMLKAISAMKPGKSGFEIDAVAREHQQTNGITPYPHALGHQIGRTVHDGGTLLAPLGERYGDRGAAPLQVNEVYTVEPVVHGHTDVDGAPIGVEQDVVITTEGAELLSTPQEQLILIG